MNRLFCLFTTALLTSALVAQPAPILPRPVPDTFERLLLPVFTVPVFGAFGSEFHTDLRIANHGADTATLFGITPVCDVIFLGCSPPEDTAFHLPANDQIQPEDIDYYGEPGRFLYVPKPDLATLAMNLRVYDVSRAALNFGTEIPVVRTREFVDPIAFTGVPTDPRFRNTLRIYSPEDTYVSVEVEGRPSVDLHLTGATDIFRPAYAVFTDFPTDSLPVRVTISVVPLCCIGSQFLPPIWAFITVTNNETQVISTITPQP